MGKVIFFGGDFSADAIGESYDLININLKDGHQTAVWRTQNNGSSYNYYSTGYASWAANGTVTIGTYTKLKGKFTWYGSSSVIVPPIVFLDESDAFVSAILPSTYTSGNGYRVSELDVAIPAGAKKVVIQCFTGVPGQSRYYTDIYAYLH